jgi:hypothetical protein
MNIKYSNIIRTVLVVFFFGSITALFAQNGVLVGPTTGSAHASAMLEISSTNKGFLLPRVNLVALNNGTSPVSGPAPGLLVYNLGGGGVPAVGVYYWDGTANAWVQLTAGGMSGSGTTNYVTKWTSSTSLGNSQLFDDATNVGIGTTSMVNKLQIDGSASVYNDNQSIDSRYMGGFIERGWSTTATAPPAYLPQSAYAAVTDAPVGNIVTRITGAQTWVYGPKISMDRTQNYLVEGWVRYTSGSPGTWYFCVQNYDNAGANISGDGTDWHYPVSAATPPATWTKFSFIVGPNGIKNHSTSARFMSVGWIANYGGGSATYEFCGWRIRPFSLPSISTTVQFAYTGADQSFTVPAGVYSIQVDLYGAAGGNGSWGGWNYGWSGGPGGYTHGTIAVTPGQVLTVMVGQGGAGGATSNATFSYGGGGRNCNGSDCQYAAKGGGRSAIRSGSTELLTAGGGGGGGSCVSIGNSYRMNGGAGGGLFGNNSINEYSGQVAIGGSQTAGGTGMPGNVRTGTNGSQFTGGTPGGAESYGGGGGGGWYGGGGGNYYSNAMGGGAGGSGYISGPGVTNAWTQTGGGAQPEGGSAGIGHGNWPYFGRNGWVIISY